MERSTFTAFAGTARAAHGAALEVALKVKSLLAADPVTRVLVFDDRTGKEVDFDLRGTDGDCAERLQERPVASAEPIAARGPGRPKLGVVAREVTLLPRHWEWLASQPGGASVALRKLVEGARRANADRDTVRAAQASAYNFMSAMAGDLPGFEEAARALFAGDRERFEACVSSWPADVRDHAVNLAFGSAPGGLKMP